MAFTGNIKCTVERASAETNLYGASTYEAPEDATCSIIKRSISNDQTTVRVDSGGSRGKGYEIVGTMLIMMDSSYNLQRGDKINLLNLTMRVELSIPIPGRKGCPAYMEVDCSIFQSN